ncbi:hypothetical protein HRbin30_00839 [bacterium HR30]|nr:hypothetical protein HRbin30_00839 [bacterium HR30]
MHSPRTGGGPCSSVRPCSEFRCRTASVAASRRMQRPAKSSAHPKAEAGYPPALSAFQRGRIAMRPYNGVVTCRLRWRWGGRWKQGRTAVRPYHCIAAFRRPTTPWERGRPRAQAPEHVSRWSRPGPFPADLRPARGSMAAALQRARHPHGPRTRWWRREHGRIAVRPYRRRGDVSVPLEAGMLVVEARAHCRAPLRLCGNVSVDAATWVAVGTTGARW